MEKLIIAIDGHSSCGKSTLAKALSKALNYIYVDSGAMYRAVTYFFLENNIDIDNKSAVKEALKNIKIRFRKGPSGNRTILNGQDVEDVIRDMSVSSMVSPVAAISKVRKTMVKQQRKMGKKKGIVMDGRDIGTVVFRDAELKIFLTADTDVRAQRRFDELKAKGMDVEFDTVKANLIERDHIDSTRKDSPLKRADDAVVIDNTNLNQEEQLLTALDLVKKRVCQH